MEGLTSVVGVERDVVVAEIRSQDDRTRVASAEVEEDGNTLAGEDSGRVFFPIDRGLAVFDQLEAAGEQRNTLHVEPRAAAAERRQHAAPVRVAAVKCRLDQRRCCDG